MIWWQQKLSQMDMDAGASGHSLGRNRRMYYKCIIKETSLLILLPVLTASLSGQQRGRGYKTELQLIKGLKGVIYERRLREMNM